MKPEGTAAHRVDPRSARSAAALRSAVLRLAESQPIGTVTVDQIVEAAQVTRKTFYNHVSNPTELLMRALTEELDHVRARMDEGLASTDLDLAALSRARLREIVEHILERRRIYQQPDGRIHPQLCRLLGDHFYAAIRYSLKESLRETPRIAPGSDGVIADIHASYIANAYAGAIDTWLPHADTITVETLLDIIIESLPNWMTTRP